MHMVSVHLFSIFWDWGSLEPPESSRLYVCLSVCLYVCLSVVQSVGSHISNHMSKFHWNILYTRSCCDGSTIYCVLPVLWLSTVYTVAQGQWSSTCDPLFHTGAISIHPLPHLASNDFIRWLSGRRYYWAGAKSADCLVFVQAWLRSRETTGFDVSSNT